MIAKTTTIKHVSYFLTTKESEKIYSKLNSMNLSPSRYAHLKGVHKSNFCRVLSGILPMTEKMYLKAFKDFNCITDLPEKFNQAE